MSSQVLPVSEEGTRPSISISTLAEHGGLGVQIYGYLLGCALEERFGAELRLPAWEGERLFEIERHAVNKEYPVQWVSGDEACSLLSGDWTEEVVDLDGQLLVPADALGISREGLRERLPISQHLKPSLEQALQRLTENSETVVVIYLQHGEGDDAAQYMAQVGEIRRWLSQRLPQLEHPVLYVGGLVTEQALKGLKALAPVVFEQLCDFTSPTREQFDYYVMSRADLVVSMGGVLPLAAQIGAEGDGLLVRADSEQGPISIDAFAEDPRSWVKLGLSAQEDTRAAVQD